MLVCITLNSDKTCFIGTHCSSTLCWETVRVPFFGPPCRDAISVEYLWEVMYRYDLSQNTISDDFEWHSRVTSLCKCHQTAYLEVFCRWLGCACRLAIVLHTNCVLLHGKHSTLPNQATTLSLWINCYVQSYYSYSVTCSLIIGVLRN